MIWGGDDCEVDRHEPCSHFAPLYSETKFRICGGSCVVESECNMCSLLHENMVNCGGSCVPRTCPPEVHPCGSIPCHNGGSCAASLVTIDRYGPFTCSCAPGWDGVTCESNVDECHSDPCLNGAACLDTLDEFACECEPGFGGLLCEIDQLTGHADRVCGPLLFFDGCDGACHPAKCVHRLAQVNIGGPMPPIQSAVAVATFSTSVDIVAEGTQSGGSALQNAIASILSSYSVDTDHSVFQVAAINQTVEASVQLPGYSEDYNSPVVEHCYSNVFALDYTGDMSVTESGRTCQRWDSQSPHAHTHCNADCGRDDNYCRNPDSRALGAWCYTTDPAKRFEKCDLGPPSLPSLCGEFDLDLQARSVFERSIAQYAASSAGITMSQVSATVTRVREAAGFRRRRRQLQSQVLELSFAFESNVDAADLFTHPGFHGVLAYSANVVALNGSRNEALNIAANDIAYSFLKFTTRVNYDVTAVYAPNNAPDVKAIASSLANRAILSAALRGAGAPGATVSRVAAVNMSIATTELQAEFVLPLHLDACNASKELQNVCIVPRVENGTALQPSFAADLAALLEISNRRVGVRVQIEEGEQPLDVIVISVVVTLVPSTEGFAGERTNEAAVLRLEQFLSSVESPLFQSRSWWNLASRDMREQLSIAAAADEHNSNGDGLSSNSTNTTSYDNATNASGVLPEANGTLIAADTLVDDGASWSEITPGCRDPECGEAGDGDEEDPLEVIGGLDESSPAAEDAPPLSSLVFLVGGYGAFMVVAAGIWLLYRCRAKNRRRARVMSNYDVKDDDDDEGQTPSKGFKTLDSNNLGHELVDPEQWRRKPPRRAPSEVSLSVASSAGDRDGILVRAAAKAMQPVLAPYEKIVVGSRVQVTAAGAERLGRVGVCTTEPIRAGAARVEDVPPGYEAAAAEMIASELKASKLVQLIWEDTGEDSGYVRVSYFTVLRAPGLPVYRPRVRDLAELRENVSSRQSSGQSAQRAASAEGVGAAPKGGGLKGARALKGARRDARKLRGEGARPGLAPSLLAEQPWWLERANLPSELMLPSLLHDSGGSSAQVKLHKVKVARRKRKQDARPSSRARLEPAIKFRSATPVNERVMALKELALTKKLAGQAAKELPTKEWPSALLRHFYVNGIGTPTLDAVEAGDRGGPDNDDLSSGAAPVVQSYSEYSGSDGEDDGRD